jgi:hypothetical protein
VGQALHLREGSPELASNWVAFEIPSHVLSDVTAGVLLAFEEFDKQFGVTLEGIGYFAKAWLNGIDGGVRVRVAKILIECRLQVAKKPRSAEATSADNNSVDAGLSHHANGVAGRPNVSIAKHLNVWK